MILFRRARKEDKEFLFKLQKESMRDYIENVWGWNSISQKENINSRIKLKKGLIIIKSGKKIGYISTFRTKKSISIPHLLILPEYQNIGIGSRVFNKIVSIANKENKPLFFSVLKVNTRARDLWQRLGGEIISEDETHFFMKYYPEKNKKENFD